mmetsp:Transcript_103825/g.289211  ORF Transcript_103825/g.289211 Transcript_103825/m.289211 type:complete len:233 (-) Transcript_103825:200-898(-)
MHGDRLLPHSGIPRDASLRLQAEGHAVKHIAGRLDSRGPPLRGGARVRRSLLHPVELHGPALPLLGIAPDPGHQHHGPQRVPAVVRAAAARPVVRGPAGRLHAHRGAAVALRPHGHRARAQHDTQHRRAVLDAPAARHGDPAACARRGGFRPLLRVGLRPRCPAGAPAPGPEVASRHVRSRVVLRPDLHWHPGVHGGVEVCARSAKPVLRSGGDLLLHRDGLLGACFLHPHS